MKRDMFTRHQIVCRYDNDELAIELLEEDSTRMFIRDYIPVDGCQEIYQKADGWIRFILPVGSFF